MMKALNITDKRLRVVCNEVLPRELHSKKLQEIIDQLLNFVYGRSNKGQTRLASAKARQGSQKNKPMTIGLSANQVGIMKKISVVDFAMRRREASDVHVFLNPKIIWHSKTIIKRLEGCVSLPGIWGEVPRFKRVKVKAVDRWGSEFTIDAKGWQAILLQHEIDHLNGILFIDHLEDPTKAHFVKSSEYRKYKQNHKTWRQFIDVSKWRREVGKERVELSRV